MKKKKVLIITFLSILSFGSLLRFIGLSNQSLWNDELSSWWRSSFDTITEVIERGVYPDCHPPGYQIILFYIEKYIGDSEIILRFPSAIAGSLSILLIFLVGVYLYSHKEGLIASALMAFSWYPLFYSQEARSYSLLLLFSLISTFFWGLLLEGYHSNSFKFKYIKTAGYIISAVLSCYIHYFGLLLIALHGIGATVSLSRKKNGLLYVFLIYGIILLAYVPWIPAVLNQLGKGPIWIQPPRHTAFLGFLKFCFNDSKRILICVLLLYLIFLIRSWQKLRSKKKLISELSLLNPTFFVIAWLTIPFLIVYIKSIISVPVLSYRNLIISLPAAYLLLARSITTLPLRPKYITIVAIGVVTVIASNTIFIKQYYTKTHKEQFREAVNFIAKYDDKYLNNSVIVGCANRAVYFNYYFAKMGSSKTIDIMALKKSDKKKIVKLLGKKSPPYLWFISVHNYPDKRILDFLDNNFKLIDSKEYLKANVWLYKIPDSLL